MSNTVFLSDLPHKVSVLFPADLTPEQIEWFWDQGVCMDDWDYMLIVRRDQIDWQTDQEGEQLQLDAIDYRLGNLLAGCCDNKWYLVNFAETLRGVGVAYHA